MIWTICLRTGLKYLHFTDDMLMVMGWRCETHRRTLDGRYSLLCCFIFNIKSQGSITSTMKKTMLMIMMITIRQRDRHRETNLTNAQQLITSQLSTYIDISTSPSQSGVVGRGWSLANLQNIRKIDSTCENEIYRRNYDGNVYSTLPKF